MADRDPHPAVAEARRWLGTPYHHQASCRGVGCDCIGLVRGIWRALYGHEPEAMPGYSGVWAEIGAEERLIEAAGRHLVAVEPAADFTAGDVLVFRYRPETIAKHSAIASGAGRMIHAYEARGVVETAIGPWWRRRLAAVFRFPEVI